MPDNDDFKEEVETFAPGVNLDKLIEEAPIIGEEPKPTEQSKEETSADDKQTQDTPSQEQEQPTDKKPEGQEHSPDAEGDESGEQVSNWHEGITEEAFNQMRTAYENREKWNDTLTNKGKAYSWLANKTPEQQEIILSQLMPLVQGQRKVPDTPEDLVKNAVELVQDIIPSEIRVEDDAGEVVVQDAHYRPVIEKAVSSAIKQLLPELISMRDKYGNMEEQFKTQQQQLEAVAAQNGALAINSLVAANPALMPQKVNDKESPVEAFERIEQAGNDHPEYHKLARIKTAAKFAAEEGYTDFAQAFGVLYGDLMKTANNEKTVVEKLAKTQEKQEQQEVGKRPEKSQSAQEMEDLSDLGLAGHEAEVLRILQAELDS